MNAFSFSEKLETLELLAENYETADEFTDIYQQLLAEIFSELQRLRQVGDAQVRWLQQVQAANGLTEH